MPANPKVQHWVPKFYLRYFATPDTRETKNPKVWIFSKFHGDPRRTSIRNVGGQNYLYSPKGRDGSRSWKMEELFGRLEALLAGIWPELANGFVDVHGDEAVRRILALFISTLHLRHPNSIRMTADIHTKLVSMYEEFPKDATGNPQISVVNHRGDVVPFDNSGYPEYKDADPENIRRMFVDEIRANAAYFAEALMEKRWSVIFSDSPAFITTDKPVTVVNPRREPFGISTPGTIISIPLSPTRVLLMDDRLDQPKGHYYPLAKHGPGPINLTAWRCCERFMISPRNTDDVIAEMLDWADANTVYEDRV